MQRHLLVWSVLVGALSLDACGGGEAKNGAGITPQTATHFSIAAPANAASGRSFMFPVTALDSSNHTVPGYTGVVHFTSTDGQAVLPPDSAIANGIGSFAATMTNLGPQQISANDATNTLITGISGSINVLSVGTFVITSGQPPNGIVGEPYGGFQQVRITGMVGGFELGAFGGASGERGNRGGAGAAWSSSALPPGLQLYADTLGGPPNCPKGTIEVIDGTPSEAGTFTFTLTASDSVDTASATYTITIVNTAR